MWKFKPWLRANKKVLQVLQKDLMFHYVRQGRYVVSFVCLSVCLPVCLLATLRKTTERIFMKILPQKYLCF